MYVDARSRNVYLLPSSQTILSVSGSAAMNSTWRRFARSATASPMLEANVPISKVTRSRVRIVQRVSGLERSVLADQRAAEQVEITNRVQHLVLDELVVVTKAFGVEHARLVEDDRILQTAAQREPRRAHRLDVLHEAERP